MNAIELLTGPIAQAIGWALLHLIWQGAIVAGILAAVLTLMGRQTANARYVVACGALALVFSMFVATAVRAYDPAVPRITAAVAVPAEETVEISLSQLPILIAETAAVGLRDRALAAVSSARKALPSIVAIWLAGVVLLSARLLMSWRTARRLAHRGSQPASREMRRVAARLSDALGLRRAVTLLESAAVQVPSVIGTLRPIILLPASALTGLTPEQVEMVLAHEMAHIRRHDFLVNLLQAVVETLMFYHPAVWWMSQRVRIERENCCDDLAVSVCGNPIQYARALTRLEELRATALPVVVAANGGSLLDRIRRIAAGRAEATSSSPRWAAAVAMLSIVILAVAVPSLPALAQREEGKASRAAKATEAAQPAKAANATVEVVDLERQAQPAGLIDDEADGDEAESDFAGIDFDDFDVPAPEAPYPPDAPEWPLPAIAPHAHPSPAPMMRAMAVPVIAPAAPMPPGTPRPARAPRAPQIAGFDTDHDFDFDFEFDYDTDSDGDREIGAGGKLSVNDLIALRVHSITPAYVNTMREIFPGLKLGEVAGMKAVGVTPDFIRAMRVAGLEVKTARDATSLSAVGVTAEYVQQLRSAGFEVKSARDATGMRAVGVTPEYVQQMRSAGFTVKTARDAQSLRAVGVTPEWLRELRAAGVEIKTAHDASSLRAVGVTAAFVKRLANAGYANLSVRELTRLAAAGVDDDFIRDMDQYRKKN